MKKYIQFPLSFVLLLAFCSNIFPCGPGVITPIFDYKKSPENPFENFAAGRIGILKPTYHRSVLYAAYRYFNGGAFSASEQKALVDVWKAEFNNKNYLDDDVSEAVQTWVEARKSIVPDEEKTPEIYVEREYGGYDFFPNCTKNAFETAVETLKDRAASHGTDNPHVKDWLTAQDKVFENCASGKQMPDEPNPSMPEWLQKDRAYQMAAASFYSLDYADARRRFAAIAEDFSSPWQETADYLVGRTLIRQASLARSEQAANRFYAEAESHLYRLSVSGNKYADSAEKLLGLVKYRLHPVERTKELAQILSYQNGGENFRQHLIDYTWLLDKFEKESLEGEEKRKEALKPKPANTNSAAVDPDPVSGNSNQNDNDGKLMIYFSNDDYSRNWTIYVDAEATDEEALRQAELTAGMPLTEKMTEQVRNNRKTAYASRFSDSRQNGYPGRYYGDEPIALSILPPEIRADDLTDWLFAFQITDREAYQYALDKFERNRTDLWLATAISKAEKSSAGLPRLLEAAEKVPSSSPAFPTVAFHRARLLIEQNRTDEARKFLDEVLNSSVEMPVSSRNQFFDLRMKLAVTLDEFLTFSQKKPFAFDFDGRGKSLDEIIEERKSWYDPKYDKVTKEEYDREIEEQYGDLRLWQDRMMFDDNVIEIINEHFPLEVLITASRSAALPEYLQESFLKAAFVRALILEDFATAEQLAPEMVKRLPALQEPINQFLAAKPDEKRFAALYPILKEETFSPFVPSGLGSPQEQPTYALRWWCAPFDQVYDEDLRQLVPRQALPKPAFLTAEQSRKGRDEWNRLKEIGDAPKFLSEKVFEWARLFPRDRRVPESLYIVYESNDWDKYGCGGNQELRQEAAQILTTKYPETEWARRTFAEPEQ
jgi:hypothetical protein